jgi:hypothetical protein
MPVRFLLDENLSPRLRRAIKLAYPEIDVIRVGDEGAPPFATQDPDLLIWCDTHRRLLVTNDRTTMPRHLADHHATSGQHWGILWLHERAALTQVIEAIHLVWAASTAEDWHNRTGWIPF